MTKAMFTLRKTFSNGFAASIFHEVLTQDIIRTRRWRGIFEIEKLQ